MQQELKPIEQVVYVKAMLDTLISQMQKQIVFIDKQLGQINIDNATPIDGIKMSEAKAQEVLAAFLQQYAAIDEGHRQLKFFVSKNLAPKS